MAEAEPQYRYRLFGLRIGCAFPLAQLHETTDTEPCDVTISRADLAALAIDETQRMSLNAVPTGMVLQVRDVGRYLVCDGSKILVDAAIATAERTMQLYLLGSAFALILHQRHILALHANAVSDGRQAIAFAGPSGAGKSTLAAAFHDAGLALLSDDVCAVRFDPAGVPFAQLGIPRLRLWHDALERTERNASDFERAVEGLDKFTVPATTQSPEPVPLRRLYALRRAQAGEAPQIRRVRGMEAARVIIENSYRGQYLIETGGLREHSAQCAMLAGWTEIYVWSRPWGEAAFKNGIETIRVHAREIGFGV